MFTLGKCSVRRKSNSEPNHDVDAAPQCLHIVFWYSGMAQRDADDDDVLTSDDVS